MKFIIRLLGNALAVFLTAYLLKEGVKVDGFVTAIWVAVALGVVNIFVKPIVSLLTLPINFITLGLFSLVINGLMILLVDAIIPGFAVQGFLWAVLFSLVLSMVNAILNVFVK